MNWYKRTLLGFRPTHPPPAVAREYRSKSREDTFHVKLEGLPTTGYIVQAELFDNFQTSDIDALFKYIQTFSDYNPNGVVINANGLSIKDLRLDDRIYELKNLRVVFYNCRSEERKTIIGRSVDDLDSAKKLITCRPVNFFNNPGFSSLYATESPQWTPNIIRIEISPDGIVNNGNVSQIITDINSSRPFLEVKPFFVNLIIDRIETNNENLISCLKIFAKKLNDWGGYLVITSKDTQTNNSLKKERFKVFDLELLAQGYLTNIINCNLIPPPPNDNFDAMGGIKTPCPIQNLDHGFSTSVDATDIRRDNKRLKLESWQLLRPVKVLWRMETSGAFFPSTDFIIEALNMQGLHINGGGRSVFVIDDPLACEVLRKERGLAYTDEELAISSLKGNFSPCAALSQPLLVKENLASSIYLTTLIDSQDQTLPSDWIDTDSNNRKFIVKIDDSMIASTGDRGKLVQTISTLSNNFRSNVSFIGSQATRTLLAESGLSRLQFFLDEESAILGERIPIELRKYGIETFHLSTDFKTDCIIARIPDGKIGLAEIKGEIPYSRLREDFNSLMRINERIVLVLPADSPNHLDRSFIDFIEDNLFYIKFFAVVCKNPNTLKNLPNDWNKYDTFETLQRNIDFSSCRTINPRYLTDEIVFLNIKDPALPGNSLLNRDFEMLPNETHVIISFSHNDADLSDYQIRERLAPHVEKLAGKLDVDDKKVLIISSTPQNIRRCFSSLENITVVNDLNEGLELLNNPLVPPQGGWQELTKPIYREGVYEITLKKDPNNLYIVELYDRKIDKDKVTDLKRLAFELDYLKGLSHKIVFEIQFIDSKNLVALLKSYRKNFEFYSMNLFAQYSLEQVDFNIHNSLESARKQILPTQKINLSETEESQIPKLKKPLSPRIEVSFPKGECDRYGDNNNPFGTINISGNNAIVKLNDDYKRDHSYSSIDAFTNSLGNSIFFNDLRGIIVHLNWKNPDGTLIRRLYEEAKNRNVNIAFCNPPSDYSKALSEYGIKSYSSINDGSNALIPPSPSTLFSYISNNLTITTSADVENRNYATVQFNNSFSNNSISANSSMLDLSFNQYPYEWVILDLSNIYNIDDEIIQAIRTLNFNAELHNVRVGVITNDQESVISRVNNPEIIVSNSIDRLENLLEISRTPYIEKPSAEGFKFFHRPKYLENSKYPYGFLVRVQPNSLTHPLIWGHKLQHDLKAFKGRNIIIDFRGLPPTTITSITNELTHSNQGCKNLTLLSNILTLNVPQNICVAIDEATAIETLNAPENFQYLTFKFQLDERFLSINPGSKHVSLKDLIQSNQAIIELCLLRKLSREITTLYHLNQEQTSLNHHDIEALNKLHRFFNGRFSIVCPNTSSRKIFNKAILAQNLIKMPIYKSHNEAIVYSSKGILPSSNEIERFSVEENLNYKTDPDTLILSSFTLDFYENIFNSLLEFIENKKNIIYVLPKEVRVPLEIEKAGLLANIMEKCKLQNKKCTFVLDPENQDKYRLLKTQLRRFNLDLQPSIAAAL